MLVSGRVEGHPGSWGCQSVGATRPSTTASSTAARNNGGSWSHRGWTSYSDDDTAMDSPLRRDPYVSVYDDALVNSLTIHVTGAPANKNPAFACNDPQHNPIRAVGSCTNQPKSVAPLAYTPINSAPPLRQISQRQTYARHQGSTAASVVAREHTICESEVNRSTTTSHHHVYFFSLLLLQFVT